MQVYYLGAGLFLALLAIADNGLELSIGIHTATNLFGSIVLKYEGSVLQTETLLSKNGESMAYDHFFTFVPLFPGGCYQKIWLFDSGYFARRSLKLNKNQENPIS